MRSLSRIPAQAPLDKAVGSAVRGAERAILQAILVCRKSPKATGVTPARAAMVRRDLERALAILRGVRRAAPIYDPEDPDLKVLVEEPLKLRGEPPPEPEEEVDEIEEIEEDPEIVSEDEEEESGDYEFEEEDFEEF